MKTTLILFVVVLAVCSPMVCSAETGENSVIESIANSRSPTKPLPLPSAEIADLSMDSAYRMQRELINALEKRGELIAGFRAGLTCVRLQRRFQADGPFLCPILESGRIQPGAVVTRDGDVNLLIGTQIGFVVGQRIDRTLKDVNELRKKMNEVFPVLVLTEIPSKDKKTVRAVDLVAVCPKATRYIAGATLPIDRVNLEQIGSVMTCLGGEDSPIELAIPLLLSGETVNEGQCEDTLGGQCKALVWLVNSVLKKGWTIEPGQILLTGTIGDMVPVEAGRYDARYGSLGTVSFTVR